MSADVPLEERSCLLCEGDDFEPVATSGAQLHRSREPFTFMRCRRCDLIQLRPRVPPAGIGAYYDESYLLHRGASAWGRYAHFVERAQAATDRARVRAVLRAQLLSPEARVLDLGCGRPTFLRALQQATGAHAVGVDFADDAWRNDDQLWSGLELHRGTLDTVALSEGFDALTMWHALEHEYDPLHTLRRLRELARPGATLVIEVPNHDSLTRRLHGGDWAGYHTPRHTAVYTPTTLARLLEKAGWTVERQYTWGTLDPYVLWWLGRRDRRGDDLRHDLSGRFVSFVAGKVLTLPITALQRWLSLGVQTAICRSAVA